MIKITNLCKSFDNQQSWVVNNVSLEIIPGKTLVLLGSSGCGKTTLLKMINRLIEPTSGTIEIDGADILSYNPIELRRHIGYVFQGVGLFPHMTIEDNIILVMKLLKTNKLMRQKKAHELLDLVNLDPSIYATRYPEELSGGQRQRVGVARALANESDYLLMDEPFGALDNITRDELQSELIRINQAVKKTIIFVTHDLFEAIRLGHQIAVMHQGQVEQLGTAKELIHHPASDFIKNMIAKPINQFNELINEHMD